MNTEKTSQISKFYKKEINERQEIVSRWAGLDETTSLVNGLEINQANHMIENVIGSFNLPMGIATNFLINGKNYLIPMVIEEPSVVAAVSFAAKLFRQGGGFTTSSDAPIMIGQIQILDIDNPNHAEIQIQLHKTELLEKVNAIGGSIVRRGGGAVDLKTRIILDDRIGNMIIVHLLYDTRDAMGANAINTAVEHIAPDIEHITGGRVHLKILSNLTDKRKARAEGIIPASALKKDNVAGKDVIKAIIEAGIFAEVDPYRATTHNKGIMNGIDAVAIATGNDWRAIESGAHAFAARDGQYTSLTKWWEDENGDLRGSIELPLAVGIVGGATRVHPTAQTALKILDIETAQELSEIMAAVGLAQNLAAIRALSTEGIQHGHMRMHARQLAISAGASDKQVTKIAEMMISENNIRLERAKSLLEQLKEG